ncbi:hypothetical protein AA0119_g2385 [Alternaria tenuissima]|jgi:hypothetical protein|uniref:Uncharacterized protein n=1 Tax=Alternaria tenuissima TaxID=119927 RepID=A0ABY0GJ37_9PLEO|nr:hypothetical protein AA0119_g2385 [Alternaria tenuissima]RYO18851.1 hypothetical protein AA0121_g4573 [Alternaria tenuissima]RYO68208.1 hypothetical protein AA0116_g1240 [Alternaria tenuissima]
MVYLTHRERQLDEMILRYEAITPPKYQLWQSSHGFTGDDAMLAGGIAGLLISFRMKGLNSISVGKRLLGRLGAVSTGTWAGLLAFPFLGLNMDQHMPSIQRSRYEEAVALRRLNDDPKFNKSLVHVPMLAERHWKRTVMAEQEAMSFASLTKEEKTVLRPHMAFSWLDTASHKFVTTMIKNGHRVEWKFPRDASPAQKRDYILREVECVAAMFRPFSLDHSEEYIILNHILFDLISGLPETEDGKHQKQFYMHDWLSLVDVARGETHVPVETVEQLHKYKNGLLKQGKPKHAAAAAEALIRDFEERALRNK